MGWVSYTAREKLALGHSAGSSYVLPLTLDADGLKESWQELQQKQNSLSGVVETQHYGRAEIWDVQLEPVQEQDSALIREFLASTADGQEFEFDPRGTVNQPVAQMTVTREDEGPTIEVFGRGLNGERMTRYAFRVRIVV